MLLKSVFRHEEPLQGEVSQLVNILENILASQLVMLEELAEEASTYCVVFWHGAEQLDHLS